MRHSNGFTLIEVMVSISVSSVLMVLSMGIVHRVLNLESNSRDQARVSRSLQRLSHDFRNDVHQAVDARQDQESLLILSLADESQITYRVLNEYVLREQVLDESTTQREYYNLPVDAAVSFTELDSPSRLEISVSRDLKLVGIAPRPLLHIVVEAGRLVRLAGQQEAKR